MPHDCLRGDVPIKREAEGACAVKVSKETLCLVPVLYCAVRHMPAEVIDSCRDVRSSAVGAVKQLSNEGWKREQLGVQRAVMSWEGDCLGCHWRSNWCGGSHSELLDYLGDILFLSESKNLVLPVPINSASKQPVGWPEVLDLESGGESGFELREELSGFASEDGVVDVYGENRDESLDEQNEDARVN